MIVSVSRISTVTALVVASATCSILKVRRESISPVEVASNQDTGSRRYFANSSPRSVLMIRRPTDAGK